MTFDIPTAVEAFVGTILFLARSLPWVDYGEEGHETEG